MIFYVLVNLDKSEEWLGWEDSNLRPTVSKTGALPAELHPNNIIIDLYILHFSANMYLLAKFITIFAPPVNHNIDLLQ